MRDSVRMLIYQMALFTLCIIAIVTLIGSFILAYNHMQVPDSIVAMGGAAVGALAGLFAPSPISQAPCLDEDEKPPKKRRVEKAEKE